MNVVHTIASVEAVYGGPSRSVSALCGALANRGLDVRLVTADDGGQAILPAAPAETIRVKEAGAIDRRLRSMFTFRSELERQVDRRRPDLIHDHGMWLPSNRAAGIVAQQWRFPLVLSPRGMASDWALHWQGFKKRIAWRVFQRTTMQRVSVFHATSDTEAEDIHRLGFRRPIAVIPNGVGPSPDRLPMRRESKPRALFLSRIHPKKGLLELLEAWACLENNAWCLAIGGPSEKEYERELQCRIEELGLEDRVEWLGPVPEGEKWDLLGGADLFVLPTRDENFGMAIAEALAAGIPVITTKAAPWGVIEERRCGWWVDLGLDPLVTALREAIGLSDDQRSQMGARGRELILERFTWEAVAEQMSLVYEWVLRGGRKPSCVRLP